jgi:hypothetical protein
MMIMSLLRHGFLQESLDAIEIGARSWSVLDEVRIVIFCKGAIIFVSATIECLHKRDGVGHILGGAGAAIATVSAAANRPK